MINSKGMPTNAVQGFMKHLLLSIEKTKPTHVAVCWDMGSKTFRNEIYPRYKENRQAPPAQLIPQFDLAKEVASAFQFPNIGVTGFEADDCIGTIAKKVKHEAKVSILSGDKDLLQLIDEAISVMIMKRGYGNYTKWTYEHFMNESGITPEQFIDVKALMGDASDGYPGVKGIGVKTAIKLIKQYGTIERILSNIHYLTPSQRKNIEADLEMLHLSRKLAKIDCAVPLRFSLERATWKGVSDEGINIIEDQELKMLRRHLYQSTLCDYALHYAER